MSKAETQFVYVTYIVATRDAVWQALTDPEVTKRYWIHANISDWKPGSVWEHQRIDGSGAADVVGHVIENVPEERLVFSWAAPG
ncbi:MAG: SRPBCC domain-containing protein, partial [Alphaproteobacteria bacterium]|nr:SRPBCC domain-containing protein [Alphaproteobacteria bacterium]